MDTTSNTSNVTTQFCSSNIAAGALYLILDAVLICTSISVMIVLIFIKKRVRLAPKCCNGHPGIPSPMDFLITPRHRWIYIVTFAVMGATFIDIYISTINIYTGDNVILKFVIRTIFLSLLVVFVMALRFGPLFACVDAGNTLAGHFLGLLYSLIWYSLTLYTDIVNCNLLRVNCNQSTVNVDLSAILLDIPKLVLGATVVVWYFYQVIVGTARFSRRVSDGGCWNSCFTDEQRNNSSRFQDTCRIYYISHVKELLKRTNPVKVDDEGNVKMFLKKVINKIFPYHKDFRFPVAYLGAVGAILMFLYQITVYLGLTGVLESRKFITYYQLFRPQLSLSSFATNEVFLLIATSIEAILIGLPVIIGIAPGLAFILCVLLLVHMFGSVSKAMKKHAEEGFSNDLPSELNRVPSSLKFVGLLIGFSIIAFGLYYLVIIVAGIAVGCVIIFLRNPLTRPWFINIIIAFLIPTIWTKFMYISQILLCKFVFFADKDGKFISITNRNLFNWFAFLLFFYNGVAGIVSAFFRIVKSAGLGLLLLFRLDQVILMKNFAFLDSGHRSFLSFFYLYYAYNNAVIHVFMKTLKDAVQIDSNAMTMYELGLEDSTSTDNGIQASNVYPRQMIRNRWHVAYTLLKNPSLQSLRKSNLHKEDSDESDGGILTATEKEDDPNKESGLPNSIETSFL